VIIKGQIFVKQDAKELETSGTALIGNTFNRKYLFRVNRQADLIVIENQLAVQRINYFTSRAEDNKFSFCCINCHPVGPEPVGDFLKFSIYIGREVIEIFSFT
jgi:hypothetical protein